MNLLNDLSMVCDKTNSAVLLAIELCNNRFELHKTESDDIMITRGREVAIVPKTYPHYHLLNVLVP